jgi:thymidylate synthase
MAEVIRMLVKDPDTRQAVLPCWNAADDLGHKAPDIPCTLGLMFYLRDGRLHCVTSMRSNDVWLGLPNDVFCFTAVQRLIADALEVDYGTYTHFVGSMHVYDRNVYDVEESLRLEVDDPETVWIPAGLEERTSEQIRIAVNAEREVRETGTLPDISALGTGTFLEQAVLTCAEKWQ